VASESEAGWPQAWRPRGRVASDPETEMASGPEAGWSGGWVASGLEAQRPGGLRPGGRVDTGLGARWPGWPGGLRPRDRVASGPEATRLPGLRYCVYKMSFIINNLYTYKVLNASFYMLRPLLYHQSSVGLHLAF
jgi:hypothetical protein